MDKEFSEALSKAVKTFGKEIVKEKRFVDIVSDYYPTMAIDHPAWKKVLIAIIVEGFGNDILVCDNSVDARLYVDKYTILVSKKNGFDKKLVVSILMELCSELSIPVAPPSQNRPIKPINPQPQPKKKTSTRPSPTSPSKGNGSKNPLPNPKPKGSAKKSSKHISSKRKTIIVAIIVVFVIMVGAAVYTYFNNFLWESIEFPIWPAIILTVVGWIILAFIYGSSEDGCLPAFFAALCSFMITALIPLAQDITQEIYEHAFMKRLNSSIELENLRSNATKQKHLLESQSLGFMGITLGDDVDVLNNMTKSGKLEKETSWTNEFRIINTSYGTISENSDSVYTKDVLDSILLFKTKWNFKNIEIKVGIHKGKILALGIESRNIDFYDKFDNDSILSMYESKYGKPEEIISNYWEQIIKHSTIKIKESSDYVTSGKALSDVTASHIWSFKTGYVILYRKEDISNSFYYIDKIIYVSKELDSLQSVYLKKKEQEEIFRQKHEEQEKIRQKQEEIKKRQRDSFIRQREHSKAANQI